MHRIQCCIPFCQRTHRNDEGFSEWICPRHWKNVSKRTRRKKSASEKIALRANQRFRAEYDSQGGYQELQLDRAVAAIALKNRIWERCKREAMEGAAGI